MTIENKRKGVDYSVKKKFWNMVEICHEVFSKKLKDEGQSMKLVKDNLWGGK